MQVFAVFGLLKKGQVVSTNLFHLPASLNFFPQSKQGVKHGGNMQ